MTVVDFINRSRKEFRVINILITVKKNIFMICNHNIFSFVKST